LTNNCQAILHQAFVIYFPRSLPKQHKTYILAKNQKGKESFQGDGVKMHKYPINRTNGKKSTRVSVFT